MATGRSYECTTDLLNALSEGELNGGDVSGMSDLFWVDSATDCLSFNSDPEPLDKVRPFLHSKMCQGLGLLQH